MAARDAVQVLQQNGDRQIQAKLRSPFSKQVTIIIVACFLIASRAAHSVLCQPFKFVFETVMVEGKEIAIKRSIDLSVYITLVEAISFPISLLIWIAMSIYSQGYIYIPSGKYRMSMYALMGFLDAINSYCGAYGATGLNIVVYTVLKSSSIVFSVVFAKLLTKKHFTAWHYLAIITMFSGSLISLLEGKQDEKTPGEESRYLLSALACFASAASLGMLGVTTYKFVRHENQKSEMLCIAENNAFQALFMFIFVLPMLGMKEVSKWPENFVLFSNWYSASTLIWISVGFVISRPIMLFSSIAATSFASAAMTRALGAPRRLIVVTICWFLFKDKIGWIKMGTIAIMCISLMIYAYGGHVLQQMKKKAEKATSFTDMDQATSQPIKSPC